MVEDCMNLNCLKQYFDLFKQYYNENLDFNFTNFRAYCFAVSKDSDFIEFLTKYDYELF